MSQTNWQDLSSVPQSDRSKLIRLASYGAISIRALRILGTDYDPQALAEKEAKIEQDQVAERDALRLREAKGEVVVWPLGKPATYGKKPWLADVPLVHGMDSRADLPAQILAMIDEEAWETNSFEFVDERDDRRRWLMEGLQFLDRSSKASYGGMNPKGGIAPNASASAANSTPDKTASTLRGKLPPAARPANRRDEEYAHAAAELVRAGKKLSEALRIVAPEDHTRTEQSVQHAIRRTFELMYDPRGNPIS